MMIIVKDKVFTFREFCQFAESKPSQEDIRLLIFECELLLDDYKSSTPSVDDIAYIINEFVAPSLRFQSKISHSKIKKTQLLQILRLAKVTAELHLITTFKPLKI